MSEDPTGSPDAVGLVLAAQDGDTLAMNDLLELLAPFVGRVCGPIALAAGPDAAQEALIALFRRLPTLREPAALFGWVRAIAVREAVRVARREARTRPGDLDQVPARDDPQLRVDVRDVLARLSPEHRAVLVLRDLHGVDEREAAQLLAVAQGTVKSRLHRARESFRKAWAR